TPIAFLLEYLQARWFGTREPLWLWRQTLAMAFLATSLTWLSIRVLQDRLARMTGVVGACLAAIYVAQPGYLEMATWPFMVMQIITVGIAALAVGSLVGYAKTGTTSDLSLAIV